MDRTHKEGIHHGDRRVDLEFETGETIRLKAGESVFIPGGMKHNEIAMSQDLEILELSVPAEMGTVPCEPPARA